MDCLRPAVLGGPKNLSPEALSKVQALSGARPGRFWAELALNWLVIAGLVTLGVAAGNLFVTVACIVLIGTRQMVFGLLLHEQVHRLGSRSKYADWFVNFFAVYPLVVTTVEDYAAVHLAHHKYFMTSRDPDFIRKSGPNWTFPASLSTILKIVVRDVTGLNTIALIRGKTAPPNSTEFKRPKPTPKWLRLAFFVAVAGALTLLHGWTVFLIYWAIPLLTVAQLFVRWIAVIEHKYNVEGSTVHEVTPIIRLTWWQKILLPDFNFAMHVYHHLHAGVSFANLPRVHTIYKTEGLVDESAVFHGQGSYLRYLIKREK
jgi:fatty acid desaturase